jgi:hypothetical protein
VEAGEATPTPAPTLATGTGAPTGNPAAMVQSNLTIDIGGVSSFDAAAICVQPPQ